MNIMIQNTTEVTVKTFTYEFRADDKNFVYIESFNNENEVIDCNLRDEFGYEIDDPFLLEEIQKEITKRNSNFQSENLLRGYPN
jgi:hypothetical protein